MDHATHNKIVSFIWSIADDCLRDVFVRGKYRDVILPMFVLRRLDVLLEPSKAEVLEEVRFQREEAGFNELESQGLCDAAGYVFYNTSQFTLKTLLGNPSQLEANFKNYLDGFSENVKEIVTHFDLRNLSRKMASADVLHNVIEKFVSEEINLSPLDKVGPDGRPQIGLSNLGMGYVFEELIRRFNEENNEEAGEHFTPREVIELMTHIVFLPVIDSLPPVITIYDPACGSGGMLTEAQNFILDPEGSIQVTADTYLYGKEVNGETYAICKSDMMIKGNDPENIRYGSTLASDEFAGTRFDFMLSNPPYGKSWKSDQKYIKDGNDVIDPRFEIRLKQYNGSESLEAAIPRSSDGQLLFLMEMVSKMKSLSDSPNGSRIASVHNGSSLFTGDAGSGESNIRRHVIENDWLDAIIQLPTNLFYNTGITTYIWVLSNKKSAQRQGKVQLIDASALHRKLRKNLGQKNCEFAPEHIQAITDLYIKMPHEGVSKVFENRDFGYHKVNVERPLRLKAQFTPERVAGLRYVSSLEGIMRWAYHQYGDTVYAGLSEQSTALQAYCEREELELKAAELKRVTEPKSWLAQRELLQTAEALMHAIGQDEHSDFNLFAAQVEIQLKALNKKLSASEKKQIFDAVSWRDESAQAVIKKQHKFSGESLQDLLKKLNTTAHHLPDYGFWPTDKAGVYLEYESDSDLRDSESIPLKDAIHAYFLSEVRPHVADAWLDISSVKIGYEISFNKYFYQHTPLRSLEDVTAEILALEQETEGLLKEIVSLGGL